MEVETGQYQVLPSLKIGNLKCLGHSYPYLRYIPEPLYYKGTTTTVDVGCSTEDKQLTNMG